MIIIIILFFVDRLCKLILINNAVIHNFPFWYIFFGISSILMITLLKNNWKINNTLSWMEFVICGGISNVIDIMFSGGVIDYIYLFNYRLNLADIMITIGICLFIFEIYFYERIRSSKK